MKKVITYGTFDMLHYGHIRLLQRAKELGDYLIVGVTTANFDMSRGKLNVRQPLMERINAVIATGIADEVIAEEYEGQKIDDIRKYQVDVFAIGSDWKGKFDYLSEYCNVTYLDRTQGISSTEVRSKDSLQIGLVGNQNLISKFTQEATFVDGIEVAHTLFVDVQKSDEWKKNYNDLLSEVDCVYIALPSCNRAECIKDALNHGKHVLCESPIALDANQAKHLINLAASKKLILFEANKTAYMTAFSRLILMAKSGIIGNVRSVECTCTSLEEMTKNGESSLFDWGGIALLPVFHMLGTEYISKQIISFIDKNTSEDLYTRINFVYHNAVASISVGNGVKSEGHLIISGTLGYIYVPAPWWKSGYFEVRYENPNQNKKYFYAMEGEGLRYEIAAFAHTQGQQNENLYINPNETIEIAKVMQDFIEGKDVIFIEV